MGAIITKIYDICGIKSFHHFSLFFGLFKVLLFLELIPYNFCLFVMFIHMCLLCVVLWSTTNYNSHWNHHIYLLRVVVLLIGLLAQVNDHGWCSLETIEDKLHLTINWQHFYNDYRLEFSKCMQKID